MMKTEKNTTVFDRLMAELMSDVGGSEMLEEGMSLDPDRVGDVYLRYRLIDLGFLQKLSLDEVNGLLRKNGCAVLYARSFWEASLIFAFSHGYSYKEWKRLRDICSQFREEQEIEDRYFNNRAISVGDIKRYLDENSTEQQGALMTRHLTRVVDERIRGTQDGDEEFQTFLHDNIEAFTPVREKARYYFCKYLYYMLVTKINEYADTLAMSFPAEDLLDDLGKLFKGISVLKRKQHSPEEAREYLLQAVLSPGGIFDEFNQFYFDYVSNDWMTILIDDYGSVDSIPEEERHMMAEHLRNYDPVRYKDLSDEDAIAVLQEEEERKEAELDAAYSLDGSGNRGYQRNRVGENTIRKYIKGVLDIDRTTLICFLLFFGSGADLRPEDRITPERLTEILLECGFPGLREEDDFDCFVLQFLESEDPVGYLMEEASFHAQEEKQFYLYRVYKASYSYADIFS